VGAGGITHSENINSHPHCERAHWKISGAEISPSEREINLRDYYYYFTCPTLECARRDYKNLISITGEAGFFNGRDPAIPASCMAGGDKSFGVSFFQWPLARPVLMDKAGFDFR